MKQCCLVYRGLLEPKRFSTHCVENRTARELARQISAGVAKWW